MKPLNIVLEKIYKFNQNNPYNHSDERELKKVKLIGGLNKEQPQKVFLDHLNRVLNLDLVLNKIPPLDTYFKKLNTYFKDKSLPTELLDFDNIRTLIRFESEIGESDLKEIVKKYPEYTYGYNDGKITLESKEKIIRASYKILLFTLYPRPETELLEDLINLWNNKTTQHTTKSLNNL